VQRSLAALLQSISHAGGIEDGLAELSRAVALLPLTPEQLDVAKSRLCSVRRYLAAAEYGSARFELRLLQASLRDPGICPQQAGE
jgi:hypothetical protein